MDVPAVGPGGGAGAKRIMGGESRVLAGGWDLRLAAAAAIPAAAVADETPGT